MFPYIYTLSNCVTFAQEGANPRRTNTLTKALKQI